MPSYGLSIINHRKCLKRIMDKPDKSAEDYINGFYHIQCASIIDGVKRELTQLEKSALHHMASKRYQSVVNDAIRSIRK